MRTKLWTLGVALSVVSATGPARAEQVKVPEGTPVQLRLKTNLASESAQEGMRVDFEVELPVLVNDLTAIPEGAVAWGAVQNVKKKKFIQFDVEGLRLPNMQQIKLRSVRQKPKNADKDQIRIETKVGGDVGVSQGAQFTCYVDSDVSINITPPPPAPPPPSVATAALKLAPELVTVQFFSDPMGADILIDGEYAGNTPSILKLTPAKHRLEFQLAGYTTLGRILDLTSSDQLRTIQVTLDQVQ
jgi:PEGA domain